MEISCIPDAAYPWNPMVMKAIWTFDPDAIPMWVRWPFLRCSTDSDQSPVIFGRHAIGRYVKNPIHELTLFNVEMPSMPCQGITFSRPNMIVLLWAGEEKGDDTPGAYKPFDMEIYLYLRARFINNKTISQMKKEMIHDPLEQREKRRAANAEDRAYRDKDLNQYAEKQLEKMGELEFFHTAANYQHKEPVKKIQVSVPAKISANGGLPIIKGA
jgi:hypothetical protein